MVYQKPEDPDKTKEWEREKEITRQKNEDKEETKKWEEEKKEQSGDDKS
jgi:hypothetical protein